MSITHIPANDWAAVGARLERCDEFRVTQDYLTGLCYAIVVVRKLMFAMRGETPIEALTAALDAAEQGVRE